MKNPNYQINRKNYLPIAIGVFLIAFISLSFSSENNSEKQKKEKKQFVLFDGKSTDAWKSIDSDNFPEHGWKVENGILTVLAKTDKQEGGHDIVTKEQYGNFELELEVRLSEGANSGVKYMVVDSYPNSKGQFLGLEYQLIDNEKHADALLGSFGNRKMAALYDIIPAREDIKINPVGQWNKVKIIVDGMHVEHWLNDKKVIEYIRNSDSYRQLVRLSKYNKLENFGEQVQGHLLLQGHGNEVSFRNIKITTW